MSATSLSSRELLTGIGVGQFNATMIIPYLMIAPATTDPKASQVIVMVQRIQQALYQLGATQVAVSGRLDVATALALAQIVGPDWERTSWGGNIQAILAARQRGVRLDPAPPLDSVSTAAPVAVGGPLDFLPDVPGGIATYAVAGYFLWRHFSKRRAR